MSDWRDHTCWQAESCWKTGWRYTGGGGPLPPSDEGTAYHGDTGDYYSDTDTYHSDTD